MTYIFRIGAFGFILAIPYNLTGFAIPSLMVYYNGRAYSIDMTLGVPTEIPIKDYDTRQIYAVSLTDIKDVERVVEQSAGLSFSKFENFLEKIIATLANWA